MTLSLPRQWTLTKQRPIHLKCQQLHSGAKEGVCVCSCIIWRGTCSSFITSLGGLLVYQMMWSIKRLHHPNPHNHPPQSPVSFPSSLFRQKTNTHIRSGADADHKAAIQSCNKNLYRLLIATEHAQNTPSSSHSCNC